MVWRMPRTCHVREKARRRKRAGKSTLRLVLIGDSTALGFRKDESLTPVLPNFLLARCLVIWMALSTEPFLEEGQGMGIGTRQYTNYRSDPHGRGQREAGHPVSFSSILTNQFQGPDKKACWKTEFIRLAPALWIHTRLISLSRTGLFGGLWFRFLVIRRSFLRRLIRKGS